MVCKDVSADTAYDVLHDIEYRRKWDTNVIETFDIGRLTVNADVGYYSCTCSMFQYVHLKVPYYTFHQFHTAVRGPTTVYSKRLATNPSMVLNFSHLRVAQVSSPENRLLLCLHLEMLKTSLCQHLPCLLHAPHTRLSPWEVFSLALGESSAHTVTNVPLNSLG